MLIIKVKSDAASFLEWIYFDLERSIRHRRRILLYIAKKSLFIKALRDKIWCSISTWHAPCKLYRHQFEEKQQSLFIGELCREVMPYVTQEDMV